MIKTLFHSAKGDEAAFRPAGRRKRRRMNQRLGKTVNDFHFRVAPAAASEFLSEKWNNVLKDHRCPILRVLCEGWDGKLTAPECPSFGRRGDPLLA